MGRSTNGSTQVGKLAEVCSIAIANPYLVAPRAIRGKRNPFSITRILRAHIIAGRGYKFNWRTASNGGPWYLKSPDNGTSNCRIHRVRKAVASPRNCDVAASLSPERRRLNQPGCDIEHPEPGINVAPAPGRKHDVRPIRHPGQSKHSNIIETEAPGLTTRQRHNIDVVCTYAGVSQECQVFAIRGEFRTSIAAPALVSWCGQLAFFKSFQREQVNTVGLLRCFPLTECQQLSIRRPIKVISII